jgi:hypothetical protein
LTASGGLGWIDTRPQVLMRVWIALPKKAALYTMNFPSEQCFSSEGPSEDVARSPGLN